MTRLRALTMGQARQLAQAGELDLHTVARQLDRARDQENPALCAYTWNPESVMEVPDSGGPLTGFGAAVKANICVQGWPTDCGSRLLADYRSSFQATSVSRLLEQGAQFIGRTAMDEFGLGSSCEHTLGAPVQNPWRSGFTAGGSSGGSAAAVAAGLAWYALGSDTGGSVRQPAHCCGLVGFKPTWGRVSRHGLVAFASSLDTVGVLARDIRDAALVLQTMAGHDPLDATSVRAPVPDLVAPADLCPRGLRVGVPQALIETIAAEDVRRDFETSLAQLRDEGVQVQTISLPHLDQAMATYTLLSCCEVSSNLARFDGSLYGARRIAKTFAETVAATRSAGFGPEVKRRILLGTHALSAGYRGRLYERARATRRHITQSFLDVFKQVDAIALPTAPETAFALGTRLDDPVAMYQSDVFTVPASLAGLPALTLPTSLAETGLPLSLQLVGAPMAETTLVQLGACVETARNFRATREAPWQRPL